MEQRAINRKEIQRRRIRYCAGCCTNWSSLPMMDGDDDDESYEYCPTCRTDSFLEEGHDGPTYSFNAITGEMIDDVTGIPVYVQIQEPPPVPANYQRYRSIHKKIK